jgi:3,4-dihydroxy 2-butanone 4-phosphate synthase/GTP cyclohydrolase II
VDLARLAGSSPAGVLCEIVNRDGTMARTPELLEFAAHHGLKCITIADLVRYRLKHERLVEREVVGELRTRYGLFTAYVYRSLLTGTEHMALVAGNIGKSSGQTHVLARIHSESMLGDVFGSDRCDSGSQLDASLTSISEAGAGVLVYLRGQQGRGLGLADELTAYNSCDVETSTSAEDGAFPVDARDYGVAAHILKDLGVSAVRLMTNNKTKVNCMRAHGIEAIAVRLSVPSGEREQGPKSRNGAEPHFV